MGAKQSSTASVVAAQLCSLLNALTAVASESIVVQRLGDISIFQARLRRRPSASRPAQLHAAAAQRRLSARRVATPPTRLPAPVSRASAFSTTPSSASCTAGSTSPRAAPRARPSSLCSCVNMRRVPPPHLPQRSACLPRCALSGERRRTVNSSAHAAQLLSAVDVHANILIVKAFQYTSVTSVTLLDSARHARSSSRTRRRRCDEVRDVPPCALAQHPRCHGVFVSASWSALQV